MVLIPFSNGYSGLHGSGSAQQITHAHKSGSVREGSVRNLRDGSVRTATMLCNNQIWERTRGKRNSARSMHLYTAANGRRTLHATLQKIWERTRGMQPVFDLRDRKEGDDAYGCRRLVLGLLCRERGVWSCSQGLSPCIARREDTLEEQGKKSVMLVWMRSRCSLLRRRA